MKLRRTTQKCEFLWGGVISALEGEGCNFSPEEGCKFSAPARTCPLYTPPMPTCELFASFSRAKVYPKDGSIKHVREVIRAIFQLIQRRRVGLILKLLETIAFLRSFFMYLSFNCAVENLCK